MKEIVDEKLIQKYLKNADQTALETLVKRYLPLVYGWVKRYTGNRDDAADITQETFVKIWKNLKRFDSSRNFRAWIFTIAKNTALDWLKQKRALPFSSLEKETGEIFAETIADGNPSLGEQVSQKMTEKKLILAMEQLPFGYGSIVNLRLNQDFSFRQIAQRLKQPLNTVKSRYRRGIILLRKKLFSLHQN